MGYQLFSDMTADVSEALMRGMPEVAYVPMQVELGGESFTYGPGGSLTVEQFYAEQRAGKFASTSQINPMIYRRCFEQALKAGEDVLYLCFSSGMSGTLQSANLCAEELREEYPARRLIVLDTLCASVGQAMLVREAARKQQEGLSIDELAAWVEENRLKICHWFTVDSFDHLKHGGRISAATAAIGTMLSIKPVMHMDNEGHLVAVGKARGRKAALKALADSMESTMLPGRNETIFISHGDSLEDAEYLANLVRERTGVQDIVINYVGPVIGAHAGPGTIALFFWGSER